MSQNKSECIRMGQNASGQVRMHQNRSEYIRMHQDGYMFDMFGLLVPGYI